MAAAKTVEQGALGGERISGERERALRLLEELTPRLVKSRQVRGKKLLPTSDADVSYGHEFTNIGEGWAFQIWKSHFTRLDTQLTARVFKEHRLIPKDRVEIYAESKNVSLVKKPQLEPQPGMVEVVVSLTRKEWTQGSSFNLVEGYVFHGTDEANPVCLQIREASSASPATATNNKYESKPEEAEKLIRDVEKAGGIGKLTCKSSASKYPYELYLGYPRDPGRVVFAVYKPGTEKAWEQDRIVETTQDGFIRVLINGLGEVDHA